MFCQLFSLQNKSFLCLQHVENKGFQTVIKHRLKAFQKPIKNELGNREKNTKNAHFVLKKCTFRFRDYTAEPLLRQDVQPALASSVEQLRFQVQGTAGEKHPSTHSGKRLCLDDGHQQDCP